MSKTWPFEAKDVADYLQHNRQFFEDYADLMAEIFLPHPHNGEAIPLAKRQMLTLREKNHSLNTLLDRFVQYGRENDALSSKIHDFTLTLMVARNRAGVLDAITHQLGYTFNVSHIALRLWWHSTLSPQTRTATPAVQSYFATLADPYCGSDVSDEIRQWFDDKDNILQSFALIPLGETQCFGALALASVDSQRFAAENDTFYLQRLRELLTQALLSRGH